MLRGSNVAQLICRIRTLVAAPRVSSADTTVAGLRRGKSSPRRVRGSAERFWHGPAFRPTARMRPAVPGHECPGKGYDGLSGPGPDTHPQPLIGADTSLVSRERRTRKSVIRSTDFLVRRFLVSRLLPCLSYTSFSVRTLRIWPLRDDDPRPHGVFGPTARCLPSPGCRPGYRWQMRPGEGQRPGSLRWRRSAGEANGQAFGPVGMSRWLLPRPAAWARQTDSPSGRDIGLRPVDFPMGHMRRSFTT